MDISQSSFSPTFGPMVEVCRQFGISRSVAFQLAQAGKLETFKIGARKYVYIESVKSLPARLAAESAEG